jgi:hypothetical protein
VSGLCRTLRFLERGLKWPTAIMCGYEFVALTTSKVPPITHLCHRHRWLGPVISGALTWHLLASKE